MSKQMAAKFLNIVINSLEMYEEDEKRINMEKRRSTIQRWKRAQSKLSIIHSFKNDKSNDK
jgi:hypothetical protein